MIDASIASTKLAALILGHPVHLWPLAHKEQDKLPDSFLNPPKGALRSHPIGVENSPDLWWGRSI